MPEIAEVSWKRPANGHKWIAGPDGQFWLTDDCTESVTYLPFREYTGLFRDFAETNPDEPEAIKQFADKHGNLFAPVPDKPKSDIPEGDVSQLYKPEFRASGMPSLAELPGIAAGHTYSPLTTWQRSILAMREVIHVWDKMDGRGELPPEAQWVIRLWTLNHVGVILVHDERRDRMAAVVSPDSLLSGLWLQLLLAIDGRRSFRRCRWCGRFFEVGRSPEIGRRTFRQDQESCSVTCRVASHRQKKYRARELAEAGKSAAAIARELGTEKSKIEKWVGGIVASNRKSAKHQG
jgi:hypothetical protein